jgi:hypothetical protein
MAELRSSSFLLSQQFTFFIGKDGTAITVHATAIAATSPQLDALINGGMEESRARCAKIEDVRVDDFVRFCEYAYCGDYTVPPWEEIPLRTSSTIDKTQETNDVNDLGPFGSSSKKKKGKKGMVDYTQESPEVDLSGFGAAPEPYYGAKPFSRTQLRTQFEVRNYLTNGGPKAMILQYFEPIPNSTMGQNFTPVLLAHARLYCFVHVRLIAPLKALTLDKLHKTLLKFTLYAERVGDIIELARFAYSSPDLPDRGNDGTLDDLRKLVVDYVVCKIDTIGKHDEFTKYMEEGGEFVGDLWRLAKHYII